MCGCTLFWLCATAESAPLFGKKGQAESTMPVVTSRMKTEDPAAYDTAKPSQPALSSRGVSVVTRSVSPAPATRPAAVQQHPQAAGAAPFVDLPASAIPRQTQNWVESKGALQDFSRAAFVQQGELPGMHSAQRAAPVVSALQTTAEQGNSPQPDTSAANQDARRAPHTMISDERLTVTGSMPHHPDSRFTVQHTPLPGARHTRSSEENGSAPEMTMSYKLNSTASASVALNPQDQTSPLYAPIVKENGLAATGVYLDVDVQEDLQLRVGGEVRSYTSESLNSGEDEKGAGASVGLRWNF